MSVAKRENINRINVRGSLSRCEVYKTTMLTIWLIFSGWLMWKIYSNPIMSSGENIWSNLIAVIGIIVATLIGWQIYSAMDWNSKVERLSKIEDGYSSLMTEANNNRNFSEASMLYLDARSKLDDFYNKPDESIDDLEGIYKSFLTAISLYTSPSVEKQIQRCIDWMEGALSNIERYNIGKDKDFQNECESLYRQIMENKHHLTMVQQGKLKSLNVRRKNLKN